MPNHLASALSPYLLQHANNPVDWYPWSEEALERARRQQKPIFLSIGYSACHWCHVMAHESFEDPATAALLNTHFVSIKVDREERPDLDGLFMSAVVAMTGQGGWPMSVFLTPEPQTLLWRHVFPAQTPTWAAGIPRAVEGHSNRLGDPPGRDPTGKYPPGRPVVRRFPPIAVTGGFRGRRSGCGRPQPGRVL